MQSAELESDQVHSGALGAALEREHREIDAGIEVFRTGAANGESEAGAGTAPASLTPAIDALRRHIYLEEEFLFPPMYAGFAIPIGVMLREHGAIWRTLNSLEAKLAGSEDRASMLTVCDELIEQLDRHNSKEEPTLYTQADRSLSAKVSAKLRDLLDSGKIPPGWTCEAART